MKTITDAFKAHIQGGVTTLCTCISITRRDTATFGLTDHDMPVTVNGITFLPFNSYARTSISNASDLTIDSLEINGILNSDSLARIDIAAGMFDFAQVDVFLANWDDTGTTMGTMSLRRGWIGEIEMNEDGTFTAEIRGLTQVFSYRLGLPYSPECSADLGDNRCRIGLDPGWWKGITPYRQGDFIIGHITAATDYVNGAITNNDFASETDNTVDRLATGWVTYGSPDGVWFFTSSWHLLTSPPGGSLYAAITDTFGTTDTSALGMYQDVDLVTSGLITGDIDTGLCRCVFTGWVALMTGNAEAQLRLHAIDAEGVVKTIWDTGLHAYTQNRWITLSTSSTLIPAGTRKVRVDFYGTKATHSTDGAAFGGCTLAFNDPNGTFNSDDQADGVMFQAQNAGVTGTVEPAFSALLGATYVDNEVTWKCVKSFKDVTTVTAVTTPNQVFTCTLPQAAGYYDGGLLIWETGVNAGNNLQVKTWATGSITLYGRTVQPITAGDRFVIHPGCDKQRATCISKFNNILNFRGEPDVPGQDAYMQTPGQFQG